MTLDEITERVIIEFLGRYEFDAIPWRVPFEAEFTENTNISSFFKKSYAPFITDKQVEVMKKMGPVDIIGVKGNKLYFFLIKKPENNTMSFSSEDEKNDFLNAKKKRVKLFFVANTYPEHVFKVYDVSKKDIDGLKIRLHEAKLIDPEKL